MIFEDRVARWTDGVPVEPEALEQAKEMARLPFVHKYVALMPDVHLGYGATIGSVIPTSGAVVPSAVGVDIGCGMAACRLTLFADDLPEDLLRLRQWIQGKVPVGQSRHRPNKIPQVAKPILSTLATYKHLVEDVPGVKSETIETQIGTLGGGNHFIEVCLDQNDQVWVMLHSGSRGTGNNIGRYYIDRARMLMEKRFTDSLLPNRDLAWFAEGVDPEFAEYISAVNWAQDYAAANRDVMLIQTLDAVAEVVKPFRVVDQVINCHHNYVAREHHMGKNVWVTRKGAVRAREGDMGIIPGSMGAESHIVVGKGNKQSFESCSHGAGRTMSRRKARQTFTVKDHEAATAGIECRKDQGVLDETPGAYKDINAVMEAQRDLVETLYTLRQVVCVKG